MAQLETGQLHVENEQLARPGCIRCRGVDFHGAADAIQQPAQIVVANILAHPLIVLAPLIARLTARGGRLALAGLLAGQEDGVRAAYEPWFDFEAPARDEGWMLLAGARRAA